MLTQAVYKKLDFIVMPRINLRKPCILGFILIVSLITFYIFQISGITKTSFVIYKQEAEISALSQQIMDLEAGLLVENSLVNVENIIRGLNYEKVNKVYYIQAGAGEMAVKH